MRICTFGAISHRVWANQVRCKTTIETLGVKGICMPITQLILHATPLTGFNILKQVAGRICNVKLTPTLPISQLSELFCRDTYYCNFTKPRWKDPTKKHLTISTHHLTRCPVFTNINACRPINDMANTMAWIQFWTSVSTGIPRSWNSHHRD